MNENPNTDPPRDCSGRDAIVIARADTKSVNCPACDRPVAAKVARWYDDSVLAPDEPIEWRVSPHSRPT